VLTKRIIPCLDIKNGRTVKGVNFESIRDAGDPVELAQRYAAEGADELVFLDISATNEGRKTVVDLVRQIAYHINIPFTIGGGIGSVQDAGLLLNAGADKVSINSSAVANPMLIDELALHFGSQFVLVAIDTKLDDGRQTMDDGTDHRPQTTDGESEQHKLPSVVRGQSSVVSRHFVHTHGGKKKTELKTINWGKEAADRGAGEILLTSMNADGTKAGFDLPITQYFSEQLSIPVIASGGAGTMQHFTDVFQQANADAALAASIFHFGEIAVPDLKRYLAAQHISIRL
jgi:imidazole glycerol-phosphate synthase subunit HisF